MAKRTAQESINGPKIRAKRSYTRRNTVNFVDMSSDSTIDRCYICDKFVQKMFYPLAKSLTQASKTPVSQKLGELVGKSCIVVVSEDDNICQSCINFLNRLDSLEVELRNVKANLMRQLENTYLNKKKAMNPPSDDLYSALKVLIKSEQEENCQEAKKMKLSDDDFGELLQLDFSAANFKFPL